MSDRFGVENHVSGGYSTGETPVDSLAVDGPVTFKTTMFPVGSFYFKQENVFARLNIQPDITPLESAHLCVLLAQAAAAVTSTIAFAWVDYINEKSLMRHFVMKEEGTDD